MEIKTGYLYHIKDQFFDFVNDSKLMTNHEGGNQRPTYFTIKDGDILWFIPLSSKIDKYEKIVSHKIKKHGFCNTIIIAEIMNKKHAILLQNAFPTLEKYIDHIHTIDGRPAKAINSLCTEILKDFNYLLKLKSKGIDLFFTDIDSIKDKSLCFFL